jgi:hypothetical protein
MSCMRRSEEMILVNLSDFSEGESSFWGELSFVFFWSEDVKDGWNSEWLCESVESCCEEIGVLGWKSLGIGTELDVVGDCSVSTWVWDKSSLIICKLGGVGFFSAAELHCT